MTAPGESRKEARSMIRPHKRSLLTPKDHLNIGCWNVRTMYTIGKTATVMKEMRRYKLSILGLSEVRWTGFGEVKTTTGETIIYSGRDEGHHSGVALAMNDETRKCMMKWNPITDRIISARFFSKYVKLTVIQIYSPTNDASDEDKDTFYELLQKEIDATPRHDVLIVLGDANAKVGSDNTGWEGTIGSEGIGVMNDNGIRFASLCAENSLVIGGTCFKHKDIHKYTWTSPNGRDRNQIDHVAIRRRFRRSLLDVRTQRGADAASDHHLVRCKIRLKLARNRKKQTTRIIYDTAKLKDPLHKRSFHITLKNRFEALSNDHQSIDDTWAEYKDIYRRTATETLGQRERSRRDWLSPCTWNCIEERRKLKQSVLNCRSERVKETRQRMYHMKDKEVKRRARANKRRALERVAEEAERAAQQNNMKELYTKTKLLSGSLKKPSTGIRTKDGKVITKEEEVLERWKDHFYEILNVAYEEIDLPEECELGDCVEPMEMDTSPFTIQELRQVISRMKNGKAPGVDNISAEMLKASPPIALDQLLNICNQTLDQCQAPSDWKRALLAKIPKKGDPSVCDNYRRISLLSVPYKIFCRMLLMRMQEGVENKLREEQAAYRRGRGTTEQIFILRNILEQSAEWQTPLYVGFIDFKKAFDSVRRDKLWNILRHYGIPDNFVNIIQELYDGSTCCVVENGRTSDWFPVETGVKQGCVMSGLLFNIIIDWVMRNTTNTRRGLRWKFTTVLEDLDYADDIALLSSRYKDLQEKCTRLHQVSRYTGLSINTTKTKVLRTNAKVANTISIDGLEVEDVNSFIYLGATVHGAGGSHEDITRRLSIARRAYATLNPIWRSKTYSKHTKLRIFKSCVISILLYGAEMWRVTSTDMERLDVFHRKCLRRILGIFWPHTISNRELYERTGEDPISETLKVRRWRWIGHVLRREKDNNCRVALTWPPEGRRKRGRPKITWRRTIEAERKDL